MGDVTTWVAVHIPFIIHLCKLQKNILNVYITSHNTRRYVEISNAMCTVLEIKFDDLASLLQVVVIGCLKSCSCFKIQTVIIMNSNNKPPYNVLLPEIQTIYYSYASISNNKLPGALNY